MARARRGAAAIIALLAAPAALAMATVNADAAMTRLPVGTQRMQMPLDCEATSLTIALASVGIHTTQQYVQRHFPTDTRAPTLGTGGLPSEWGDPYTDFVGHVMGSEPGSNPHWATYAGWGAYAPTVAGVAKAMGVPVALQLTGWNPQALYAAVEAGHPVLVWTTVNYRSETARTWTAWDGRTVPWTEAGHVVVLMGVDPVAGKLEFSDPLIGGYNSTTMAQFARTFSIYGDMAIVIERTARAATPAPVQRHRAAVVHAPATHVAVATAAPWVSIHHTSTTSILGGTNPAAYAAASLGLLTSVAAVPANKGGGAGPVVAMAGAAAIVAIALLAIFMRRRRRDHAMGDLPAG